MSPKHKQLSVSIIKFINWCTHKSKDVMLKGPATTEAAVLAVISCKYGAGLQLCCMTRHSLLISHAFA